MIGTQRRLQAFLVIGMLLGLSARAPAQEKSIAERVDAIFARYDRTDAPGVALGVISDGELIYARGYGMANLEYGIPITPKSVFRIGSTSKQFTAMSMVLLDQEGLISLDDDIRTYLPEIPDYGAPITIRHLLYHTSGVRDYLTVMSLAGKREDDFYTDAEVVEMLARQKRLNFPPGEEHLYSNAGYFLLSQICLRASGKRLREYAQEKIFGPLGMRNTHFHDDHNEVVPNRAAGYSPKRGGGYRINMTTLDMVGDGGVFTTVEDLLLWDRNFYSHRVGGDQGWERMLTPGRLNDGTELDYAFGLGIDEYRGLKMIAHGGAFVGFRADMIRFPEQRFTVICLANRSDAGPTQLALKVADIYLEDVMTEREERPQRERGRRERPEPLKLAPEALASFAGDYYSEELDATYHLRAEADTLFVKVGRRREGRLLPYEGDTFRAGLMTLRFQRDSSGTITGYLLDAGRARNFEFVRKK